MQKVTFSCSRCSTKIEAAGENAELEYDCPTCGKSLRLRNASTADETCLRRGGKRGGLGVAAALFVILIASFAVAFALGKGRKANPSEPEVAVDFGFLEWDEASWKDRLGSSPWRIVAHDPLKSGDVIATSSSGANVAVAFREDGRPGSITIVSRTGQDDLKNCFRAAYDIAPDMARQFARMLRVDPAVMEGDRRYQLGHTPYAMGAANGNSLWLDYVGSPAESLELRSLESPQPAPAAHSR